MSRLITLLVLALAVIGTAAAQAPAKCPTIDVTGPVGVVQPGEELVFIGEVDGVLPTDASFQWSVSSGKIVKGQGALKISVDTGRGLDGTTITATLNVLGFPKHCPNSVSALYALTICSIPILTDEFGKLTNSDARARIKVFFTELQSYPTNQGYIIVYGTEREMTVQERLVRNQVTLRGFDSNRITIVRGGTYPSGTAYTRLYRVPPGAENPTP